MSPTAAVVTPYSYDPATVELAEQRRYRKQILPRADIDYQGRTLRFDDAYLSALKRSFDNRAFDQVPFQLADGQNSHTNDPERFSGSLIDVECTDRGLDGIFELTERGEKVISDNPQLGVSARIIENFHRNGQAHGHALQHVLGTLDPHITGMGGWQSVEMARVDGVTESLDLSDATYKEAAVPENQPSEGGTVTLELSQERHAKLLELLDDYEAATELGRSGKLDHLQESDEPQVEQQTEQVVEASHQEPTEDPRVAEQASQIAELQNKLQAEEIAHQLSRYSADGLAPAIIEAARPLVGVNQPIELSRGGQVDVAAETRKLLDTVLELARTGQAYVDLDAEEGHYTGSDSAQSHREAQLDAWANGQF